MWLIIFFPHSKSYLTSVKLLLFFFEKGIFNKLNAKMVEIDLNRRITFTMKNLFDIIFECELQNGLKS